jgi:ABC-type multidrug transport system ATPase subunit
MSAPKLLLLDEPSLGLSPILTREVGSIIKKIADQGVSILLIEQNANLALQLARKCYVLETGRIALEGSSKELQNNEHVKAAYLGISCTLGPTVPPTSNSHKKTNELPSQMPAGIQAEKRPDIAETIPQPQSRRPAKDAVDNHASGLPETPALRESGHGMNTTARPTLDGGGRSIKNKDTFAPLSRDNRRDRLSRVVKRVFTPKKG